MVAGFVPVIATFAERGRGRNRSCDEDEEQGQESSPYTHKQTIGRRTAELERREPPESPFRSRTGGTMK
jgi:hypothetical protein